MTCAPCRFVWALAVNVLFVVDIALNVLGLGRPPESVSRRMARLRADPDARGQKFGAAVCSVLTWIGHLFGVKRDHCTWALEADGTDGTELWRLSK